VGEDFGVALTSMDRSQAVESFWYQPNTFPRRERDRGRSLVARKPTLERTRSTARRRRRHRRVWRSRSRAAATREHGVDVGAPPLATRERSVEGRPPYFAVDDRLFDAGVRLRRATPEASTLHGPASLVEPLAFVGAVRRMGFGVAPPMRLAHLQWPHIALSFRRCTLDESRQV
jgi:hypothetical protein